MQRRWHPDNGSAPAAPGFAMIEAAAIVAIGALLVALVLIAGADSRRQARLGEDIAKLRQFGAATGSYAADNGDLFWSFSWKKGAMLSQYPDLNQQAQASDLAAASAQGVDILRRLAGRQDINAISNWYPHLNYAHWVLSEHFGKPFPDFEAVSAADTHQVAWARDPHGFDAGLYQPAPSGSLGSPGTNNGKRWPYRSTFQVPAAVSDSSTRPNRVEQAVTHYMYFFSVGTQLGARPTSEVTFPAHKAFMWDEHARHFGVRKPYCTHDEARLPILFVDGSVPVRAAKDANPGGHPNTAATTQFTYQPNAWEPPTMSGAPAEVVIGRFRWTRGCPANAPTNMLAGRDFGGPEPCTPPP